MTDEPNPLYAKPFFQTILLTDGPIDAAASRIIVDVTASAMKRSESERAMVCMTPLRERVSLPDWRPETLRAALGSQNEVDPGEVPPLEAITGGTEVSVADLKARMDALVAEGTDLLEEARDALASDASLFGARAKLQAALEAWTIAEMINVRLYSMQFRLQAQKADPEVDRG